MISATLIILAAICNACMDNIKDHWYESVFNKLNPQWWDPSVSWKNKLTFKGPVQLSDCWHLAKTIMLTCLILAVVLYKPMVNWYVDFAILGFCWIGPFNFMYNKILIRK